MAYAVPGYADHIMAVNTQTKAVDTAHLYVGSAGHDQVNWSGGALIGDVLYAIPWDHSAVLVANVVARSHFFISASFVCPGGACYSGGAVGGNGKIYAAPFDVSTALVIDPATDTAATLSLGAAGVGGDKYGSATTDNRGRVYFAPYAKPLVVVIDTLNDDAISLIPAPATGSFSNLALGSDGNMYSAPYNAHYFMVLDTTTQTISEVVHGLPNDIVWGATMAGADGRIYGVPFHGYTLLVYDPVTGTLNADGLVPASGCTLGGISPDGVIFCNPSSIHALLVIDTKNCFPDVETTTTASSEATTTSSTADPLELEGFVLAYEGAVPENTDSPLRFGTAFDTSVRLATYTNIPNADCASHCISDDACEGIFVWHLNGSEKRCLLLSSLGQPIATGTVSYSFVLNG